ncbi:MAG: PAS domain S-box protein [Calditrichaeota bacterium]|nr:MAG: PAS domain S-box protein [Calditrichota bacterium]
MHWILSISILIRLIALGWSIYYYHTLRDRRIFLFTTMFALMALRQIFTYSVLPPAALSSIDFRELPGLLVSLLAFLAMVFIIRLNDELIQQTKKLKQTEIQFQRLLNSVRDVVWAATPDGKIFYINSAAEKIYGRKAEDFLDHPELWLESVYPEDRDIAEESGKILLENGYVESEYRIVQPDGQIRWLNDRKTLIYDEEGKLIQIGGIATDITERKKAEKALQENLEYTNQLLQTTLDGYILADTEGQIVDVNPSYCQMVGYTKKELLQMNIRDVEGQLTPEEIEERINLMVRDGKARFETRHIHKDGHPVILDVSIVVLKSETRPLVAAFVRDVTRQRILEKELRESEQRYSQLFEEAPIPLWEEDFSRVKQYIQKLIQAGIKDFRKYFQEHPEAIQECASLVRVLDVNHAALQLHEAATKEMLIENLPRIFTENSYRAIIEQVVAIAEGRNSINLEGEVQTLQGKKIIINLVWTAIKGYEETLERVLLSTIDITEQKNLEKELRESEQRYSQLFEEAPIPLWEEDFSRVKQYIQKLKQTGIKDFRKYFQEHPEAMQECASLVRVLDVNHAALQLHETNSKETLIENLPRIFTKNSYRTFIDELVAIAEGRNYLNLEGEVQTLQGKKIIINLIWSVVQGYEETLERVLVSTIDITERVSALQEAEESRKQLRALAEYLQQVREDERLNVARELHDELGQILTVLKIDLNLIEKGIQQLGTSKARKLLEEARQMRQLIDGSIETVRRIIRDLRPEILDNLGLLPAIEWQLEELQKRTGIEGIFNSNVESLSLSKRESIAIFRIVQEALTNVARHSRAKHVYVDVKKENNRLHVKIRDDGIGIPREKLVHPTTFGLLGMQERAIFLGGKVDISAETEKGTTIEVTVPFESA